MAIQLRPWKAEDRAAVAALCDAVDRRFLSDRLPQPYTAADADSWLCYVRQHDEKEGLFRAILVDGEVVGMISAEQKQDVYRKDAELGYSLATNRWSQGVMTEAVRQFCPLAFAALGLVRMTGMVYEENIASRKVLEKNGFILEGTLRKAVIKAGRVQNLCIYGKLNPEAKG